MRVRGGAQGAAAAAAAAARVRRGARPMAAPLAALQHLFQRRDVVVQATAQRLGAVGLRGEGKRALQAATGIGQVRVGGSGAVDGAGEGHAAAAGAAARTAEMCQERVVGTLWVLQRSALVRACWRFACFGGLRCVCLGGTSKALKALTSTGTTTAIRKHTVHSSFMVAPSNFPVPAPSRPRMVTPF